MIKRQTVIAETLRHRVYSGMHLGLLKAGDRLPSVRDLARELDADPRVILAACRELEREGLLELRQRSGVYIVRAAGAGDALSRREADWIVAMLVEGLARDITGPGLPEHLRRCLESVRIRAVCIECNWDQTDQLCQELTADYGMEVSGIDIYTLLSEPTPPPEVRGADLLVTSQFHVHEVQPLAVEWGKPLIIAALQPGLFSGIADLLAAGPVYFVVSDPRYAAKLKRIFASASGAANLRPLVVDVDRIGDVPTDGPLYVTDRARDQLPATSSLRRSLPHLRAISPDTARQLFSFIVRANVGATEGKSLA